MSTYQQSEAFRVCEHCRRARSYHKWNGAALACPKPKPLTGYRFYAELPDGRGGKSGTKKHAPFTVAALRDVAARGLHNNVCAVPLDDEGRPLWQGATLNADAVVSVRGTSNSPVCGGSVSRDYLRTRCVRVPQALARQLHPQLFAHLEA
jgi:hypothetical protein